MLGDGTISEKEVATAYQVRLATFVGPLDLLLQLIQRNELDITEVSLAVVADQYLQHIQELPATRPGELVEFLTIAAQLLLIKSRLLLPTEPSSRSDEAEEEEAEVGQSLVRQLEAYRRYRAVAERLQDWEETGRRAFLRTATPGVSAVRLPEGAASPTQLVAALEELLATQSPALPVSDVLSAITINIDDQMALIRTRCKADERLAFHHLVSSAGSRMEIIVTFLALLELVRLRQVVAWQEEVFGEILITRRQAE